jgi:hypothetical protein
MSLEATKTLLNIFKPNGILQSDTQTVDTTDKKSAIRRQLAQREISLLNTNNEHLPIGMMNEQIIPEEQMITRKKDRFRKKPITPQEPLGKSFKVNDKLFNLGVKPSDNINTSRASTRKKILRQKLNELKNGGSIKTKRKLSTHQM